jgi:CRISPR-associated protein Cmr5
MSKKDKHKKHQSPQMRPLQGAQIPDADKNKATINTAVVAQRNQSAATSTTVSRQSLAQLRAISAHRQVTDLERQGVREYDGYASYVRSFPAKIMMSGLGQALAMEKAQGKKKNGHKYLYQHMTEWLIKGWSSSPYRGQSDIVAAIIQGDEKDYIRTQMEAMEYLIWLKKFSDAELESPVGEGDE